AHVDAFLRAIKVTRGVVCGETIAHGNRKHLTVLLAGVASTSVRYEDGQRQIRSFHYQGDFVGLHHYLFPLSNDLVEVEALATCSIGTIDDRSMDRLLQRHAEIGKALWRAATIEASILRQRVKTMRRPALQRVAHILSEQLTRRAGLGISTGVVPLSQI